MTLEAHGYALHAGPPSVASLAAEGVDRFLTLNDSVQICRSRGQVVAVRLYSRTHSVPNLTPTHYSS
ncbi:MAG: hypothetical protein FJX76_11395 [Armatimonadetes bacterium]|nr:hypothetical protein [Armatimonadota bacterium]